MIRVFCTAHLWTWQAGDTWLACPRKPGRCEWVANLFGERIPSGAAPYLAEWDYLADMVALYDLCNAVKTIKLLPGQPEVERGA